MGGGGSAAGVAPIGGRGGAVGGAPAPPLDAGGGGRLRRLHKTAATNHDQTVKVRRPTGTDAR